MNKLQEMNNAVYYASKSLVEASQSLAQVEEFMPASNYLLKIAYDLASVIRLEPQKLTDEHIQSIMDEILKA